MMQAHAAVVLAGAVLLSASCGSDVPSTSPTPQATPSVASVTVVFQGSTSRRTDLPASAQACVDGVGLRTPATRIQQAQSRATYS